MPRSQQQTVESWSSITYRRVTHLWRSAWLSGWRLGAAPTGLVGRNGDGPQRVPVRPRPDLGPRARRKPSCMVGNGDDYMVAAVVVFPSAQRLPLRSG